MTTAFLKYANGLKARDFRTVVCGWLYENNQGIQVRFTDTTVSLYSFGGYYHRPKKEGEWIMSSKNVKEFFECLDMLII
jgi:hypothetical protein